MNGDNEMRKQERDTKHYSHRSGKEGINNSHYEAGILSWEGHQWEEREKGTTKFKHVPITTSNLPFERWYGFDMPTEKLKLKLKIIII